MERERESVERFIVQVSLMQKRVMSKRLFNFFGGGGVKEKEGKTYREKLCFQN